MRILPSPKRPGEREHAGLDVAIRVARRHFDVDVEFSIEPGERFVLFGPSGAGKTTVLEAIAGLVRIDEGCIRVGVKALTHAGPPYRALPLHDRGVGLVRQDPALFPHLSVARNIGFARALPDDSENLVRIANELGLARTLESLPGVLSGGQRQRVALARVLLSDYSVLLLDEPYSGLDGALQRELTRRAVEMSASVPSILVTHDLEMAQSFGERIGVIDQGKILRIGSAHDIVLDPGSPRVAELVGYRSFVDIAGTRVAVHPDRVLTGDEPGLGIVLSGSVAASCPAGVLYEISLDVDPLTTGAASPSSAVGDVQRVVVNVPDAYRAGDALTVTLLDPPIFAHRSGS